MLTRGQLKNVATLASIAAGFVAFALPAQPPLPQIYSLRATGRTSVPTAVRKAIDTGLEWLARHQEGDGSWDPANFMKHDPVGFKCTGGGKPISRVGVTGLTLLAFLADDNTLDHGAHQELVKTGISWLVKQQSTSGPENGRIGPSNHIYGHLFATHALLEAYGLSRAPRLKDRVTAAVDYIQRFRHPESAWRYQPGKKDADTPLTVLAFMVLRCAQEFGIGVDESHAAMTTRFLDEVTSADGLTGYHKSTPGVSSRRPGGAHARRFPPENTPTLTAASLTCRFMLGQRSDLSRVMQQQIAIVRAHPPDQPDFYYWYYASLAMRQVGGNAWSTWSRAVRRKLLARQRKKDSSRGSWDIDTVWGDDGGRVYTTAIALLTLQAGYRYAPLSECTPFPAGLTRFQQIRSRWIEHDFGGVWRSRNALAAGPDELSRDERAALATLDTALDVECNRALKQIQQLGKGPDFLAARKSLTGIATSFRGLPPSRQAKAMLKTFTASKGIKREIAAMSAYRRAVQPKRGRREALVQLAARYEGTYAATLAARETARK